MTNNKVQIKQALLERIELAKISQNKLAKQIGVSTATISNMLNEKHWDKISGDIWAKAFYFLGLGGWAIVRTGNYSIVEKMCIDAQHNKRTLAIIGETGYGKTTALETFYKKHADNVGYVLCDCLMTQTQFLRAVASSFGLDSGGTKQILMSRIVDRMRRSDNPLLILDDLGKVRVGIYRLVQLFYDRTEAGIVLAGTPYLQGYVDKAAGYGKMGFSELKSRIEYWQILQHPSRSEIMGISKNNGIAAPDCLSYMCRVVNNFRDLARIIKNVRRIVPMGEVTLSHLETANR